MNNDTKEKGCGGNCACSPVVEEVKEVEAQAHDSHGHEHGEKKDSCCAVDGGSEEGCC